MNGGVALLNEVVERLGLITMTHLRESKNNAPFLFIRMLFFRFEIDIELNFFISTISLHLYKECLAIL